MEEAEARHVAAWIWFDHCFNVDAVLIAMHGVQGDRAGLAQQLVQAQRIRFGHTPWPRAFAADAIAKACFLLYYKDAEASVIVAESPNGLFAHAVKVHSFHYGLGSMPSIWGEAFSTREEAFNAGLHDLLDALEHARPSGKAAEEELRQLARQVQARLGPKQGLLFG